MYKKILIGSLGLFLPLALFAQTATISGGVSATTTASTTPGVISTINLVCMQNAIEKRDTALIAAEVTANTSIVSALTTRKNSLKAAWTLTDVNARATAIVAAEKAYRVSVQATAKTKRTTEASVAVTFKTDTMACGKIYPVRALNHKEENEKSQENKNENKQDNKHSYNNADFKFRLGGLLNILGYK